MSDTKEKELEKELAKQSGKISEAIRLSCEQRLGVLDSGFLCQSVSALNPKSPICVQDDDTVYNVLKKLREHKIGCVLVLNKKGKLTGIFSERDLVLKVLQRLEEASEEPISKYMTPDPICETPQATIAYVLNLMSQGGFRHLPIVDPEGTPVGIVSIKDVVDQIVNAFMEDVLNFQVDTH